MQRLEVSGAVRPIYGSLGVKRLINSYIQAKPFLLKHSNLQLAQHVINIIVLYIYICKHLYFISSTKESRRLV